MSKVLLVGLNKNDERKADRIFGSVGVACEKAQDLDRAFEKIQSEPPVLVVTHKPDRIETLYALQGLIRSRAPLTPFLVVMNSKNMSEALDAMKAGAYDCLSIPFDRFQILATAKRAAAKNGRTLFVAKVKQDAKKWPLPVALVFFMLMVVIGIRNIRMGPPEDTLSLGSATVSGIQWEERSLWVGNWFDSTIIQYELEKGLIKKKRPLKTMGIYRMQDTQPILVCNTPEALISVGFDLKLRSHQRFVGLPALLTVPAPGPNPTGLAWDGKNIWSSDRTTHMIYKHGQDLKILESVPSIIKEPVGISWDGESMWVLGGGSVLKLARWERLGKSWVWRGPYTVANVFPEGATITGMGVAFNRLWMTSGGDPRLVSRSLEEIIGKDQGWTVKNGN